jgi:hypothetical protein
MKKPAHLKTKDPITSKRNKAIPSRFETRKQKYAEIKELRQKLKERKSNKVEAVKILNDFKIKFNKIFYFPIG